MYRLFLFAIVLLVTASPDFSWNKAGHMVTGAIAYDVLMKDSPDTVRMVVTALEAHPQAELLKQRISEVPVENRDRALFMVAARWGDDIRGNEEFHRGPWHYINFPVMPADPAQRIEGEPPAPPDENILSTIRANVAALDGDDATAKAIAITWLFHQVGDLHQPCHAVAIFSKQHPTGDRGGNDTYVRTAPTSAVMNLHSLWDGLVIGSMTYQDTGNEAIRLRLREDLKPDKLPGDVNERNADVWAAESVDFAQRLVYWGRTLQGGVNRRAGPVLPVRYLDAAKYAAEQRVVMAGYRLAGVLRLVQ